MQNTPHIVTAPSGETVATGHRVRPGAAGITLVGAAAAGMLVWSIATVIGGVHLAVPSAGRSIGLLDTAVTALVAGGAGWLVLALFGRTRRGRMWWTVVAVFVLVLSLAGPLMSGAAGGVLLALEAMHVVVGVILILGLRLGSRTQPTVGSEES